MDRQTMIYKIYEVIADKSETEWCICEVQLPIELSTNITNNSHGIEWFVQSLLYEWVYMFYLKRIRLNWWLNIIEFDSSELPPVFDKYKGYVMREKEKFYIKKATDTKKYIWHHNGCEYFYQETWDWKHWKDYFKHYNHNSKEKYSITHQDRIQDMRWKIDLDANYNVDPIMVIWHPVMIGNILSFIANKHWEHSFIIRGNWIINFWERQGKVNLLDPIEKQGDDFIEYVYNLLG